MHHHSPFVSDCRSRKRRGVFIKIGSVEPSLSLSTRSTSFVELFENGSSTPPPPAEDAARIVSGENSRRGRVGDLSLLSGASASLSRAPFSVRTSDEARDSCSSAVLAVGASSESLLPSSISGCLPIFPSSTSSRVTPICFSISTRNGVRASQAGDRFTSSSHGFKRSSIMMSKPNTSKQHFRWVIIEDTLLHVVMIIVRISGRSASCQKSGLPVISPSSCLNWGSEATAPTCTCFPFLFTSQFEMCFWRFSKSPRSKGSLHSRR
mmetsp:Transcript_5770/g.14395  ORF Transcript_5770/g.14395 Transcript_5770/m.14395 type:complete len:265 (-) Transcript_5770:991-1785(-)